ncbi:hypothetical protein INS49_012619 [Diaporthe citri]|uniref:uncharacterized protein n=1 Tax=Diaporthe citri TaxID=83186 RepID=UPI001C8275D7|nr:uncharacterized protein INS49_012619 [Diaporthe citri]KAG6359099.1 hypothetical protein INS49_012619 [Diaporthe citri]
MAGSPYFSTSSTMAIPGVEYIVPPGSEHDFDASPESQRSQRVFKRHKVLPHPRSANGSFSGGSDSARTPSAGAQSLSPLATPAQSSEDVPSKASPSTPPNQRSPPTPDVTPPQSATRPRPLILRPALADRIPSKGTTESRTESFKTARESPEPSDEEDGRSTLRPAAQSARTSEVTVRLAKGYTNGNGHEKQTTPHNHSGSGLGLGPSLADEHSATPKARGDFTTFDGEFGSSPNDVEQEWDDNLMRNVTVRKRRPSAHVNERQHEVVDDFTVSPTNATKALRAFPLQGRILTYESPDPARSFTAPERANVDAATTSRIGEMLLSAKATPFSQASVETNGTSAADIGEARAISMFPHQNRSILMVDHRPSESSDGDPGSQSTERPDRPTITTTEVDGVSVEEPMTPLAQPTFTLDSVDSPLRNPREPPEPPAIKFIPATPSGLTPAEEKTRMLGNFYDELDDKPMRAPSLVRRALNKRRHSYASYGPSPNRDTRPGFLARTLSLSKNIRKGTMDDHEVDQSYGESLPHEQPMDETRLHPDWRPSYYSSHYADDGVYDMDDDDEEVMRYPAIDNRPPPPKRSLSERMKRTFAIMPLQDVDDFTDGPDRRTIRRTPSGNLRVVKHRGSVGSLRKKASKTERPSTAPDGDGRRRLFWSRSNSLGSIRGQHVD